MSDFEEYGFREVPFPVTPEHTTTHWAGREELLEELLDLIDSPRESDIGLSEFVVLHGSYGAGKSHALRYLRNYIDQRPENYRSRAIYVQSIRIEDKISFLALYREIIRLLGDEYIFNMASQVNAHIERIERAHENAFDLEREGKLRDVVLKEFERELQPMLRQLCEIAQGDENRLRALETGIRSDFEAAKSLGAFFGCLKVCKTEDNLPLSEANYVFLDEVEATTEVKVSESQAFFNAMLQLVNQLPYNFCLLCSFSGDTALLEAVVNEALLQRMTRDYIELPELEPEEAKHFLAKQFETYRTEGFKNENPYHPFTERSIEYVLDRTLPTTPRNIFRALRKVLERSVKRDNLVPGEEIQREDAERILN